MKIKICVGETCHLQGAEEVVKTFKAHLLETQETLSDENKVQMKGCFCMNHCRRDRVSVEVDSVRHSLRPAEADAFFKAHILPKG